MNDEDFSEKKKKQDLVRELGAIPAVLAASGALHTNQIRNWAIQVLFQIAF